MMLKWNRLAVILVFGLTSLLVLVAFYGNYFFLTDVREQAQQVSQVVDKQKDLLATYPPDETELATYQSLYEETQQFLPEGEQINAELLHLEALATVENVTIASVSRVEAALPVEEIDGNYFKSRYQVEMTSAQPENMQALLEGVRTFERIWNVTNFTFTKAGETDYSGSFAFEVFYHDERAVE